MDARYGSVCYFGLGRGGQKQSPRILQATGDKLEWVKSDFRPICGMVLTSFGKSLIPAKGFSSISSFTISRTPWPRHWKVWPTFPLVCSPHASAGPEALTRCSNSPITYAGHSSLGRDCLNFDGSGNPLFHWSNFIG